MQVSGLSLSLTRFQKSCDLAPVVSSFQAAGIIGLRQLHSLSLSLFQAANVICIFHFCINLTHSYHFSSLFDIDFNPNFPIFGRNVRFSQCASPHSNTSLAITFSSACSHPDSSGLRRVRTSRLPQPLISTVGFTDNSDFSTWGKDTVCPLRPLKILT